MTKLIINFSVKFIKHYKNVSDHLFLVVSSNSLSFRSDRPLPDNCSSPLKNKNPILDAVASWLFPWCLLQMIHQRSQEVVFRTSHPNQILDLPELLFQAFDPDVLSFYRLLCVFDATFVLVPLQIRKKDSGTKVVCLRACSCLSLSWFGWWRRINLNRRGGAHFSSTHQTWFKET